MADPVHLNRHRLTMAITELDIGGAEQAFVRVAIGLRQRGWDVGVISVRDAGALAAPLQQAGITVKALGCGGFGDARAIWRMKSILSEQRPDILLTFLHHANIAGRIAGRWAGIPRILSGIRVADRRWSVRIAERLTSCCVDQYVAVSQTVADVHGRLCGITDDRIRVIRNGVDIDAIDATPAAARHVLGYTHQDFVVLCAGRLTPQKAPLDVLSSVARLVTSQTAVGRPLKLLFVGEGPTRSELERRIKASGLENSVRLLGHRKDVISLMKAADVLVLASRWEGLPNVILEAQAAGLPVIASSVDGCTELISDGLTGRLFPPGKTPQLSNILNELMHSPASAAEMSAAARKQVSIQFHWEVCINDFERLLLEDPI